MRRALVLASLSTLCGCGLLFLNQPIGKDEHGFDVSPPDDEPPHALLVEGEIRDFLTLHAEKDAVIDVWTSDPDYAPAAHVDETGHYSLPIELCRKEATAGEEFFANALVGGSHRCARWLDRFRFRARLGDRCSITYGSDRLPDRGRSLVLWLHHPCRPWGP